eukprot:Pgem_evm1s11951
MKKKNCYLEVRSADRKQKGFRSITEEFIPDQQKLGMRTTCTSHPNKGHYHGDGFVWFYKGQPISNFYCVQGRAGGKAKNKKSSSSKTTEENSDQDHSDDEDKKTRINETDLKKGEDDNIALLNLMKLRKNSNASAAAAAAAAANESQGSPIYR